MQNIDNYLSNRWFSRRSFLLAIGSLLILLSDMPGSSGLFAWIMPVPFLVYISLYWRMKEFLWLFITLISACIATLLKAFSQPVMFSVSFAILSGFVTGLRYSIAIAFWGYLRRKTGLRIGILAFPALIVSLEYIQSMYTPLGVWGSLSNTQLYNLPLLQSASLFGFLGISALISWAAVLLASVILTRKWNMHIPGIIAFAVILTGVLVYGDIRLDMVVKGPHQLTAAITSEYKFTGVFPAPDSPEVQKTTDILLNNTRTAAQEGASIAVWGEGSTLVTEANEKTLTDRLSNIAKTEGITIAAAYAVLPGDGTGPVHPFENKITWVLKDGTIARTYRKHHPIPGEGSIKGTAPYQSISIDGSNVADAICYDYDFPDVTLRHARLKADLVVLPGLDWRGMLRRHSLMARIRAIEGGYSILRPANGATSMAFDGYGQIRAAMTDFGDNSKVLLASLPMQHIETLYSRVGNMIAYFAIASLLFCLGAAFKILPIANNKRREKDE